MEMKIPQQKTPEKALESLMATCARMERCEQDVRMTLKRWHIEDADAEVIVARLVSDRFVDNQRYAMAFVREKVNSGRWGRYKIVSALNAKRIPKHIVEQATSMIDDDKQKDNLLLMLQRKAQTISAKDDYDLKSKLFRFGMSRGYEYDELMRAISSICHVEDSDE